MKRPKYIFLFLFSSIFVILLANCRKDQDVIPYVAVDISFSVSDPNFFDLNSVGGWVYIIGGSRGIIVYKKSSTEFMAYDRHCTYKPSTSCAKVDVDKSQITAVDSCCGSKFLLTDGSVVSSPATIPLKSYQTTFDGNVVHIFN